MTRSAKALRKTPQREAVLRAARSCVDHPTAERIYDAVRRELPRVSLGTVYRNLQKLVSEGELTLAPRGKRSARFDPMTEPHDHFVCQTCERIFDVTRERIGMVDLARLSREGFEVRSHSVSVYGTCPECRVRQPPAKGGS